MGLTPTKALKEAEAEEAARRQALACESAEPYTRKGGRHARR